MHKLTSEQLNDLTNGACILASGGGGPISMKDPMLKLIRKHGSAEMVDVAAIADDALVVVLAAAGSPLALKNPATLQRAAEAAVIALDEMEKALGRKADYLVAIETGVGNTLFPIEACAVKKIPVIDGAGARRSVPALTMCTFSDLPISPVELAASRLKKVGMQAANAAEAEEPMMAVMSTQEFGSLGGIAFWPMSGKTAKRSVSRGTVTYTIGLGATLRKAKRARKDPVKAVVEYTGGTVLFEGKIESLASNTNDSFDFMTIVLKDRSGRECRVMGQNESLIAWVSTSSHPVAMGPDLICYLTADGDVCSNADLEPVKAAGKDLAVIGIPCPEDLQKPGIQRSFLAALRNLGYGGPYVPLAELERITKAVQPSSHATIQAGTPTRWWRNFR